ncbi:hypothetical protein [Halorussus amylolyticus]|uniref:hypothetical protein n=1 Tax=Halorussus amylolyticus TaxID=1126242 RepID=UPI0010522F7D|nr:hypothetical protein [Halorussus amylolyticus]
MPSQPTDPFREESSHLARLLGAIRTRTAGVLAIAVVLGVVALPHPLPEYPAGAYALVGVAEGVGLAVAAENLLYRPAKRFDFERATRKVGAVAGAVAAFVVVMSALGVELSAHDRSLLAGFCLSAPASIVAIDYLKARVRGEPGARRSTY